MEYFFPDFMYINPCRVNYIYITLLVDVGIIELPQWYPTYLNRVSYFLKFSLPWFSVLFRILWLICCKVVIMNNFTNKNCSYYKSTLELFVFFVTFFILFSLEYNIQYRLTLIFSFWYTCHVYMTDQHSL